MSLVDAWKQLAEENVELMHNTHAASIGLIITLPMIMKKAPSMLDNQIVCTVKALAVQCYRHGYEAGLTDKPVANLLGSIELEN